MTDVYLILVFLFCAAAGYIAVSRGGGFLEQNLFRDSEMWYTVQEDSVWASPRNRVSGRRRPGRETKGYKVRSGA